MKAQKVIIKPKLLLTLIITTISIISNPVFAQESNQSMTRKAQISFFYPLGSNGMNSQSYSNKFSFNILFGLNGGLNGGIEIGGLMNLNEGEVRGFQLSGITNVNKEQSSGLLLTGVTNICIDSSSGVLISGILNYTKNASKGILLSTINVAKNEFTGFQLGVVNYAQKLRGVQLGVINVVDDGENAIPIGLINIVKNGHYEIEATAGEVLYANLNYKMGVERFYTIFKTGYSSYRNEPVYSYGIGFGGIIPIAEKHELSIDLSTNVIIYSNNWSEDWRKKTSSLHKADFNYRYTLTQKISILVGPSFNVYQTNEMINGEYGTLNIPYTMYKKETTESSLSMWVGFNAGLSIKL